MMMTESAPATPAPAADSALTPAAAGAADPPSMTLEQAQAKKAELVIQTGFAERVMRGDPEASKLWREVTRALRPAVDQSSVEGQQYAKNQDSLSILRAKADLPDAAWDWAAAGGPVSPAEKINAAAAKARNFRDKAWVQRYLDGDRQANSEMVQINMVLAAKVGTFDEIEAFKITAAKRLAGTK
jgi:hypothetical protein